MTEPTAVPVSLETLPAGQYAIVEALGHRTLVGRIDEVECFGTKMLQVEPLVAEVMLGPVLVGGGSIYMLTRCSAETAWKRRPKNTWSASGPIATLMPPTEEVIDDDDLEF